MKILDWKTMRSLNPSIIKENKLKISLFLLIITVGLLIILDQIVICWNPKSLGISRILPKRAVLKTLPSLNMSLPIGDIYLKEVRDLLFVRMLIVNLQNLSRTCKTCHFCGVSGHIRPHYPQIRTQKPWIKNQEPKKGRPGSNPSKTHHAPRQKWQFPKGLIPHAVIVARLGTPKPNASSWSLSKIRFLKGLSAWWRVS
jgi:hypothetical protein